MKSKSNQDGSRSIIKGGYLLTRIRRVLAPPEFPEDEEKTRLARGLNILLLSTMVFLVLWGCIAIPFFLNQKLVNAIIGLVFLAIVGVAYWLMRQGRVRSASVLFTGWEWAIFTIFLFFSGGINSIVVMFYFVGILITRVLLGMRGAQIYFIGCVLASLCSAILETNGFPLPNIFPLPSLAVWLSLTIALLSTVVVLRIIFDGFNEALLLTRQRLEERKRAEEALRISEERFSRLSAVASEGIVISDQGTILDANPQIANMLGYGDDPNELIGLKAEDFVAPESRDLVMANMKSGFEGPYEHLAMKKDGSVFLVEIRARTIPYKERQARVTIIRDITERKQVEDALRESEERFSSLSDATSEGIGITDQGRIVDANPQLAGMLGYKPDELIGMNASDFVAPESRDLVMANEMAEFVDPYEHLAIKKDGTIFPVEIRANTIPYKGRQTRVAIIRDITERKQAEKNIAQQVERLRALHSIEKTIVSSLDLNEVLGLLVREIVNQLQVDATSVLLLDSQKQTLTFGAGEGFRTQALRFTHLKVGSGLAGRAASERKIVHIPDLAEMTGNPVLAKSIINEKFVTYLGVPLIAKDQLCGVLEIFHRSRLDPDPGWLTFLETLAAQAAISIDNSRLLGLIKVNLKETNALYRINKDLVAGTDPEQLMKNVVNLLQEEFGYYYVQIFIAEPQTGDFVVRAGSGNIGEQLVAQEYRLAAGDGIVGYTAETGTSFFTNDVDKVISYVANPLLPDVKSELAVPIKTETQFLGLLDVNQIEPHSLTERDLKLVSAVADQLALALQKAQLYTDLQNSLRQEQATQTQLVQAEKLAVAGRLLASVSHELNNPLQAIQNTLFLLKDEAGISEQGQQDLSVILSETERMASLIDRLRTTYQVARAEDFQPVQVNSVIEDVHKLMTTHLRHARISYDFHPNPDLPSISGLGDQLKQVMLNLFMNAADAMPGGGRLSISTAWLSENQEVLITVTDTGTGINETIIPNLFNAFTTNKATGTGLGLSISYDIISKHRGRIQGQNNPEGGATFSIWLPVDNGGVK
jgi:PAS domain S-box-containing protein